MSRADVFRASAGTRQMFVWFLLEVRRQQSPVRLNPSALALGDEGVAYSWSGGGIRLTVAVWRYRRVFSVVGGGGLARSQVLGLARKQQRRIAAALR